MDGFRYEHETENGNKNNKQFSNDFELEYEMGIRIKKDSRVIESIKATWCIFQLIILNFPFYEVHGVFICVLIGRMF